MGEPWKAKIPEPKIGKSPRLDVGRWTNKHAHDLDLGAGLIPVSVGQNLVAISFSASLSPKFDPYEDHISLVDHTVDSDIANTEDVGCDYWW